MMTGSRHTTLLVALSLGAVLALASAPGSLHAQGRPRVLVIGIDGVRPDVLAEVPTPVMDSLAAAGWYTAATRTTTPSVSGPSWSSMLNGVWPEKHGVTGNTFEGRRYGEYPDFLTLLERWRPDLGTFAAIDWLPLAVLEDGGALLSAAIDTLFTVDGYELGWAEADGVVAERAARHLAAADPDAAFVYLGNPDETSHRHASIGAEYRDAIALSDRHVGQVLEALRARPTYAEENWLVLISTDHGRREDGGHGGASPEEMTTFILAAGPATRSWPVAGPNFIVDVAATALQHLGMPSEIAPDLDGRPLGTPAPERPLR
ncbi:alkaline phosphatase family protein [Candidatus Palauibacter sp.]|uniref:alkaline phosphatase family protein n=1 Tax=Candidatus Palauibacter sp. TaxID=3101350 RepID=UPI003B0140B5